MDKNGAVRHGSGKTSDFLQTGIEGFDAILNGGLPAHHLYLLQGLAGSGKTTLACQIGFHHAKQGRKVLILTLIAESHAKLLQHLSNFNFFDDSLLNKEIIFFGGYSSIAEGGLRGLLDFITTVLNEQQPELLIIDGFRTVRESRSSDLSLSEFMHSLNSLVSTMGCTTFLLSPTQGNLPDSENTLVDGLIELSQYQDGVRTIRELKVFKVRGSNHLLGQHAFEVKEEGIVVYPRLEAVATCTNIPSESSDKFARFGIPSLDRITGGVMVGSITNLVGKPGAGKTLMGLHFIHQGLLENENCLMLGFYESPQRLLQKSRKIGIDLSTFLEQRNLEIIWRLPLEVIMDELAQCIFENIDRRGVKRVFIDGVDGFRNIVMHPERIKSFLIALVNELRRRNVTTFFTQELPYFKESFAEAESIQSVLYENMLLLNYSEIHGINRRLFSVLKLRENDYEPAIHLMEISDKGISINAPVSSLYAAEKQVKGVE
jgi:circadian clock protein KaiC